MFERLDVAMVGVVSDGRFAVAATKGRKLLLANSRAAAAAAAG
jgi:hypothetical protein